ncbi:MAG TPA: alpha/beta fold hydrolase [Gemmatimonadales bacterium]
MPPPPLSRRDVLRLGGAGLAACLAGCAGGASGEIEPQPRKARLASRPLGGGNEALEPGTYPLKLRTGRDGLLYVPRCPRRSPTPLVVMLHGAGGSSTRAIRFLSDLSDQAGFLVLCPDSRGSTWDAITGEFGPDVEFIDRALAQTFSRCGVDRRRLAVAGFSDGATYALALARANGDLFTHAIAFSPGFLLPVDAHGLPRLFISHGVNDQVLPIDRASRAMVPELRAAAYRVAYREFDGGHGVPPAIARKAVEWYLDASNFPTSRVLSECPAT